MLVSLNTILQCESNLIILDNLINICNCTFTTTYTSHSYYQNCKRLQTSQTGCVLNRCSIRHLPSSKLSKLSSKINAPAHGTGSPILNLVNDGAHDEGPPPGGVVGCGCGCGRPVVTVSGSDWWSPTRNCVSSW